MEILILDKLMRPIDVVDEFISMIWTERYAEVGDFELVTLFTTANSKRFVHETMISITESKRVMIVENIEETNDPDKGRILKIKGRDIVSILQRRVAMYIDPISENVKPIWYMSGFGPANTMRFMFWRICIQGHLNLKDQIPFMQWGAGMLDEMTLYPPDTIEQSTVPIIWGQKIDSLYNAIKDVADLYDLGFRMYKDPNSSNLYFNAYSGSDRTTAQSELPPVIFSTDMDSLQNTTEFSDSSGEYNVVHVLYTYESGGTPTSLRVVVYDPDFYLEDGGGFDRKVKVVVVTSLPEEVTDTLAYLEQLGTDELAKSRPFGALDGEINQFSNYVYEKDYYLGDMVETRSSTGATSYMRVEEQIIVQDSNGQRSYPGLVSRKFIEQGTWASWKYDVEWQSMGSEEYWSNQ